MWCEFMKYVNALSESSSDIALCFIWSVTENEGTAVAGDLCEYQLNLKKK